MLDTDTVPIDSWATDMHYSACNDSLVSWFGHVNVVFNITSPSARRVVEVPNLSGVEYVTTLGSTLCAVGDNAQVSLFDISSADIGPVYDTSLKLRDDHRGSARVDACRVVVAMSGGRVCLVKRHSRMKIGVEWEICLGRKTSSIQSVAATGSRISVYDNGKIMLFDVETSQQITSVNVADFCGESSLSMPALMLLKEENMAVVSSRYLYRLQLDDLEHVRTVLFQDHAEGVALVPGGDTFLCAFRRPDCEIQLFDLNSGALLWTQHVAHEIERVCALPDGKIVYYADKQMHMFTPPENIMLRIAGESRGAAKSTGDQPDKPKSNKASENGSSISASEMKELRSLISDRQATQTMDRERLAAVWAAFCAHFQEMERSDFCKMKYVFSNELEAADIHASDIPSLALTGMLDEFGESVQGAIYRAGSPTLTLGMKHRIRAFLLLFGREN